jgi:hypothetical protein
MQYISTPTFTERRHGSAGTANLPNKRCYENQREACRSDTHHLLQPLPGETIITIFTSQTHMIMIIETWRERIFFCYLLARTAMGTRTTVAMVCL